MRPVESGHLAQLSVRGLTLIELMVAMTLGGILCLVTVTVLLYNQRHQHRDAEQARLQENGRYAQRFIARELTMAGFYGGLVHGADITAATMSDVGAITQGDCFKWLLQANVSLEHFNNATQGRPGPGRQQLPTDCLSAGDVLVDGTDMLVVRRVKDTPRYRREAGVEMRAAGLESGTTYLYLQNDAVPARLQLGKHLSLTAPSLAAWEYYPLILFIRDWSVIRGDGIPALCRKRIAVSGAKLGNTACLVEGVENMQVEYGIDHDGDFQPDRFVDDLRAVPGGLAVIARVSLLLRSLHQHAGHETKRMYDLGPHDRISTNDGYQRRVFQVSSVLRNRGPQPW